MAVGKIVNLLRGSVRLEVAGEFPERFLNLCAQRGVAFWAVDWPDSHTLRLTVAWRDAQGLEELAQRCGCTMDQGAEGGLPPFLLRFRKRYAFLAGLALALAAVCLLSRFIMVVEVEGNQRVPSQLILSELQRQGLRVGVYGPGLELRDITNEALLHLEELSWLTVNIRGIRAQVVVREKLPQPEVVDETVLGDIVATAPGLVTRIEAWEGDAAVKVGDTVLPGDILIRGQVQMDPPVVGDTLPPPISVRAQGVVEGRTWRVLTASIPLTAQVKTYTGEETALWSVSFFGRRVNFFQNSGISYGRYDKIGETWNLTLPGGTVLPFALRREVYRAYETSEADVNPEAARTMLEDRLLGRLKELLGETGTEAGHTFQAWEKDGVLTVRLTAECREELGRFVPTP